MAGARRSCLSWPGGAAASHGRGAGSEVICCCSPPCCAVTHELHKAGMLPVIWSPLACSSASPLCSPPPCCAVTHELHKAGMLPAIWFIFSRRDCDLAARQLAMHGTQLTSDAGEG